MSQEIFEKNLEAMAKWYPVFCELIREKKKIAEETEVIVQPEISWDGEVIFRVEKEGRKLYLNGKRNAKAPVKMWLERLGDVDKHGTVFLFGIGSGLYLKALLQNTDKETNVVVYEPSISVFLTFLEQTDLSEEIGERPIAFLVEGINESEFEPVLQKVLVLENLVFLKEEIHPNYKIWFAEKIITYVKILHKKVELMQVSINSGVLFRKQVAMNVMQNMRYLVEGYHTKSLAEALPVKDAAILVAAGPSLNKNIQTLQKAKNRAFILAVDTAVKPLLKAGIVPDAFITIDPNKKMELFEIDGIDELPVIAPEAATGAVLERQHGKKIFYDGGYCMGRHIYQMNGKYLPDVQTGGSVACSGFSLLYKMEFSTIILVGQDLAYTGNKSHADGTFQEKMEEKDTKEMILVKGNYEEKVPTLRNLRIYLEWFERYIKGAKAHRNLRVVNATEGGAYIEGTELYTLEDILEELQLKETDFTTAIADMKPALTLEERKKAVAYLHSLPDKFAEAHKNAQELKKAYKKLEKIGKSGNLNGENAAKRLKAVKKIGKKEAEPEIMQLINATIPMADYILRSEYFYEYCTPEEEVVQLAKKGIRYNELLMDCTELLKGIAEEILLPIPEPEI